MNEITVEEKRDSTQSATRKSKQLFKNIQEWAGFSLAVIGSILGLLGFLESRENAAANNKIQATIMLNEAWDLLGGKEGTDNVEVSKFVKSTTQLELARRKIETAKTLAPNYAKTFSTEGAYFLARNRLDEAVKAYETASSLDPKWHMPFNNLGTIFAKQEKWDEALSNLQKAAALESRDAQTYSNICYVLWKQKKLNDAVEACQHAIKLDAEFILAYSNLANVLREQGKQSEAATTSQDGLRLMQQLQGSAEDNPSATPNK